MSLISELFYNQEHLKAGDKFGFIAYGSGSKSKVFEGQLVDGFSEVIKTIHLDNTFNTSNPINFETYESLHKKERTTAVILPESEFALTHIDNNKSPLKGKRLYEFVG